MRTIDSPGGVKLHLYADSKEMPSKRYSQFQKYLLYDVGIGSDLESISAHFTKLYGLIAEVMTEHALKECENMHFNFYSVLNGINYKSMAFAVLIAKIDDEPQEDISEDGLKSLLERIDGLDIAQGTIEETIGDIKKKIGDDLKLYFPRLFPDDSIDFFQKVKQRTMLAGELLLMGDKQDDGMIARIKEISKYFLMQSLPESYRPDDPGNCIVSLEKSFAQLTSVLGNNGAPNADELPVFNFYAHLDYLSKPAAK